MELSEYTELERVLKRGFNRKQGAFPSYYEKIIDYDQTMQEYFKNSPPCVIPAEIVSSLPDDPPELPSIEIIKEPEAPEAELQVEKELNYRETYFDSVAKISTLTQSLMNTQAQERRRSSDKANNMVELLIYLFGTLDTLKVSVAPGTTIDQLISRIISLYMKSDKNKAKPLPKGPVAEGYRIWFIDEENCFPDTDITIDRNRTVKDLDAEKLAFCAISGFDIGKHTQALNKHTMVDGISLFIFFNEKKVHIGVQPDTTLTGVLAIIENNLNFGYMNPSEYEFRIDLELEDSIETEECIVDMNVLVSDLRTNELKLYKKVYADMPVEVQTVKKEIPMSREDGEVRFDPSRTFLSRAQACLYKEYEVIKTNKKGKKQKRILGIDQQRLYNMTEQQAKQPVKGKALQENDKKVFRKKLVSMFKAVTQHPEIMISSILNIQQDPKLLNCFNIEYVEAGVKKRKVYETEKSSICAEIVAKITIILQL